MLVLFFYGDREGKVVEYVCGVKDLKEDGKVVFIIF